MPETRQVYMADREDDIMAILARARDLDHASDYLICCQHDRTLPAGPKLWAQLKQNTLPVTCAGRENRCSGREHANGLAAAQQLPGPEPGRCT